MAQGYTECSKCLYPYEPSKRRNDTRPAHFPCKCPPRTCITCCFAEALVRLDVLDVNVQANDTKTTFAQSFATCEICGIDCKFDELII